MAPAHNGHLKDFVLRLSKSTSSGPIGLVTWKAISSDMAG